MKEGPTCMVTRRSSTITSFVKLRHYKYEIRCVEQEVAGENEYEQVCADSGLVLIAKPLVHILVHERSLADSGA